MYSYNILGDYVAADFFPVSESRIEVQMPFSHITELVLADGNSPEEDRNAVRTILQPFFTKIADFLLIDLQDAGMLAAPEGDAPDALRCSRARWKDVIGMAAQEILTVYTPQQIIVNEHFSSTVYLEEESFRSYENSARISRCNMLMRFLFTEIESTAQGCHIIPFPADVFDISIPWEGEREFQYHPCYYHYGQQASKVILDLHAADCEEPAAVHAKEENRIAILHERCSEQMGWLACAPVIAAEEDFAERRRIRDLKVSQAGEGCIKLEWAENIYAQAYLVECYENGSWVQVEVIDALQAPCCLIRDLDNDRENYFRVSVQTEDASHRYGQYIYY